MILRLILVLLALSLAPAARGEAGEAGDGAMGAFFFGNSLIWHQDGGDESAVPYWLALMAQAGGQGFAADGTWGFPADFARALPPSSDWRIGGVARLMSDNPRSFRMAGFDAAILAPPNFVQWAAPDRDTLDGAMSDLIGRTFDWTRNQGIARLYIYEGWPDMGDSGAFPPEPQAFAAWRDHARGAYDLWYRDLTARLAAGLPGAEVGLIPVARVMAGLLAEGPLAALAPGDLFVDDAPHGTPAAYLLAAMITHSALQAEPAPAIALPAGIPPVLRDNYPAIAEAIWREVAGAVAPPGATLSVPETGLGNPSVGYGLAGIADWSSELPFLDLMKTARPWVGHLPGQWGAVSFDDLRAGGFLSPEGWPLAIPEGVEALETFVLTDLPEGATTAAGRYVVTWRGEGRLTLGGRARAVERGDHEARFTFVPGEGPVAIRLEAISPADPLRDISVLREDRRDLARAGLIFNPDFLAMVRDARVIRFMDWMATNGSTQVTWDDRPRLTDATWAWRGVPVEVMVDLANLIGADPWFTLPHMADDAHVAAFATLVRDRLDPRLRVHAEWSNEVWNFVFPQAQWAASQARARWGEAAADSDGWIQFAGTRAAEVADIWARVFGDQAQDRLVRVVAVHTGWPGLEEAQLDAPLRQAEGLPAPARSFDAYAVTGYFGAEIGSAEEAPALSALIAGDDAAGRLTERLRDGSLRALVAELWPYHARAAAARGLSLLMYEGGSHLVAEGAAAEDAAIAGFLAGYSYGPEMAGLYAELLAGWRAQSATVPAGPFMAFVDVAAPSRWGSWGARRHLSDVNPRWATLAAWNSLPPEGEARAPGTFGHGVLRLAPDSGGRIEGTGHADILIGGPGGDVIVTGGGDDLVTGGEGQDRAILPGTAADWTPALEGAVLWMTGPAGTVRLEGIEEAGFSDDPGASLVLEAQE
ncbi:MAG: calcium-binding protein [Rubellimicrobium sp.]|nr:calcium-binding protein [Rubellimicrobium sp.]